MGMLPLLPLLTTPHAEHLMVWFCSINNLCMRHWAQFRAGSPEWAREVTTWTFVVGSLIVANIDLGALKGDVAGPEFIERIARILITLPVLSVIATTYPVSKVRVAALQPFGFAHASFPLDLCREHHSTPPRPSHCPCRGP